MTQAEIKEIVNTNYARKYLVKCKDGSKKYVRLWVTEYGVIAIMNKGKRKWGRELISYFDHYDEWKTLSLVEHSKTDLYKRYMKRAKDAHTMLSNSGLWKDIKECIEHFLNMSEEEQNSMVNDITTDVYNLFYKRIWEGDKKYDWVTCYQVFESFAKKRCWKSIAWGKWKRERMSVEVAECIKNGTNFHRRWENGYDCSIEVVCNDGYKRGWYSEEFHMCANGHYYLLFDATHAIFYEDD